MAHRAASHGALLYAVLRIVRAHGAAGARSGHVASMLGRKSRQVATQFSRMVERGTLVRVGRAVYIHAEFA